MPVGRCEVVGESSGTGRGRGGGWGGSLRGKRGRYLSPASRNCRRIKQVEKIGRGADIYIRKHVLLIDLGLMDRFIWLISCLEAAQWLDPHPVVGPSKRV